MQSQSFVKSFSTGERNWVSQPCPTIPRHRSAEKQQGHRGVTRHFRCSPRRIPRVEKLLDWSQTPGLWVCFFFPESLSGLR